MSRKIRAAGGLKIRGFMRVVIKCTLQHCSRIPNAQFHSVTIPSLEEIHTENRLSSNLYIFRVKEKMKKNRELAGGAVKLAC